MRCEQHRELLLLAAEAAKLNVDPHSVDDHLLISGQPWNPLRDHNDATRLAEQLGMSVNVVQPQYVEVMVGADEDDLDCSGATFVVTGRAATPEQIDDATRLAIVQAAAMVGTGWAC